MEHRHTETKRIIDRLSRTIGHLEGIRTMVQEGRDCSDVLIQISAVRASLAEIGKLLLSDHIEHCVAEALETGDGKVLDDLNTAIDRFIG